jgi:hypothetical protein
MKVQGRYRRIRRRPTQAALPRLQLLLGLLGVNGG